MKINVLTNPNYSLRKTARRDFGMSNTALKHRLYYGRRRKKFTVKEPDAETGLYYYGARYLDPKTARWLSGDPAMGEYVPGPGQEAGKLPGQGGVFNYVNLHSYHYAGNNPVKLVDPDGEQAGPPPAQQPNNLPPINIPYYREPAYQGMIARHKQMDDIASVVSSISNNALGILIDRIFLGGKFEKAANEFAIKVSIEFSNIKAEAIKMFKIDLNGHYSDQIIEQYVDFVNNSMTLNYSNQKELGPYEKTVILPKLTKAQALFELDMKSKMYKAKFNPSE